MYDAKQGCEATSYPAQAVPSVRDLVSSAPGPEDVAAVINRFPELTAESVFIVGVHRRCGSNFVAEALRLHAAFGMPEPIVEDYLLEFAHLLKQYVDQTLAKRWKTRLDDPDEFDAMQVSVFRRLGDALTSVLCHQLEPGKRLLTKTPDPHNLDLFFTLFPQARLVLLVRDGRDVAESSYRSWPSESRAHWMRTWAQGARSILDFVQGPGQACADRWKLCRYEELCNDRREFYSLLEFVGISPDTYPWAEFESLPLFGSSVYRGGRKDLHWDPVARPENFRPTNRWEEWGWFQRWQFNRLAGREQRELGYLAFDRK